MRYNTIEAEKMKKTRIYLDTSIINFAINQQDAEKNEITKRLIVEIKQGKYEAFISKVVLFEIDEADEKRRKELLEVIKDFNPRELLVTEEVERLSNKYIKEGIIPLKYDDDARHIAVASVNNLDVIVSWNFEHIVKYKTKQKVKELNVLLGYKEIDIYSPLEVVENV